LTEVAAGRVADVRFLILLKNPPFILRERLRVCTEFIEVTNGGTVEVVRDFPFMLSRVEAFLGFFSRIFSDP
jgi:hypothetical protein